MKLNVNVEIDIDSLIEGIRQYSEDANDKQYIAFASEIFESLLCRASTIGVDQKFISKIENFIASYKWKTKLY